MMNADKKLLLLKRCPSEKAMNALFDLFIDLDNANVKYDSVTIDILEELKEFKPCNLDEKSLSSFQNSLADCLKDGKTEFDYDVCIHLKDAETGNETGSCWIFNVNEAPTAEWLRNRTWKSLVGPQDLSLNLLFEDNGLRLFTEEFFKHLDRKYSYPHSEIANNAKQPDWTSKTYYPWYNGMWSSEDLLWKDETQHFATEVEFLRTLLGDIEFRKASDRRKQRYLDCNPALNAQRADYLMGFVCEVLKIQPGVTELKDSEMAKLLATVDKILYKLYPEYKVASLV